MRINSAERTRATSKAKASRGGSNGVFTPQNGSTSQSTATMSSTAASSIASIDTLIALQEGDDFRQARKAATQRADDILDILSGVRLGLLEGVIPRRALQRLNATLAQTRASTGDVRLETILNEVELRAQVEMAKLDSRA